MNRGFVILAQNNTDADYIKCAEVLADSIRNVMPNESVSLITDKKIKSKKFNKIILFPYGDQCLNDNWKLANDWQVYDASPYEYTIKIEADMYLSRSISNWFEILKDRDINLCQTIRNYKNDISSQRFYRKIIDENNLPDIYNAITYFKKSDIAKQFYVIVRNIFENWNEYKKLIKCYDTELATTDIVYAIAAKIIGVENCTLPNFKEFSFIHMKKFINNSVMTDWCDEFLYEIHKESFRINTIPQFYPLHYYVKNFAGTIESELND